MTVTQTKFVVSKTERGAKLVYAGDIRELMFESFTDAIRCADQLTTQNNGYFSVYLIKESISNIYTGQKEETIRRAPPPSESLGEPRHKFEDTFSAEAVVTEKFFEESDNKVTMVDPPSGWRYGFPAPLKEDYKQQLLDAGYPEKDIELALKYSRYWETAE